MGSDFFRRSANQSVQDERQSFLNQGTFRQRQQRRLAFSFDEYVLPILSRLLALRQRNGSLLSVADIQSVC